jgi:hypothetical protein
MSNRDRRIIAFACIAVLGITAAGVWLLWPRPTAITSENAERIQFGMTLQEVEAILGGPARDETDGRGGAVFPVSDMVIRHWSSWKGREYTVLIAFENGRVEDKMCATTFLREETLLQMARRWLRL